MGPELKFTESNSQAYKFLGSEKYQPVLTSIYAGLGIPPTLTGAAGQSGGYTNNFVSLKTLIERLEYGRSVLTGFWQQEIEYVRKAMGFRLPAEIHFDSIVLSDEAAQKKLLMDLADRDIISHETLLERFREIPTIERVRVRREERERVNDSNAPRKAGPYHNPQHQEDMAKIGITKDVLDTEEYFDRIGLPYEEKEVEQESATPEVKDNNSQPVNDEGRPPFSKDIQKRKEKRVLPRSTEPTSAILWGIEAQEKISNVLTPIICDHFGKKNARALTKAQIEDLEYLKLSVFTALEPMIQVDDVVIHDVLVNRKTQPSKAFYKKIDDKTTTFETIMKRPPSASEMRHIYASASAEIWINWTE